MQKLKLFLQTVLTIAVIIGITTALFLYTSGYRLEKGEEEDIDISKTGMVSAKSIPEGASVFLDDELRTATNDTVAGLKPGTHNIRIVKKGFLEWEKDIEIFEELVTDITSVLVSQSPRIEPLTNTGARNPTISPSLSKIAYFSSDTEEPGIWIIPLSGSGLNLFRLNPTVAIQDTRFTKYSFGKSIEWSPDENSLLVQGADDGYFLIDNQTNTAETVTNIEEIKLDWKEKMEKKRSDFLEKLEIPEELAEAAQAEDTMWAPDEKKFLYKTLNNGQLEYRVYNMERPLPIGEKINNLVFTTDPNTAQPNLSWYSDSFHLILVEGDIENENRGSINMIRIDGTNKTELYNNTLYSDKAYSAPGGDKVIILTSFKSAEQTDLYTVSIR
jgi:hypothetical protein